MFASAIWRTVTQLPTNVVATVGPAWQVTTDTSTVPPAIRVAATGGMARSAFAYGDKLKITFFERINLAVDPGGSASLRTTTAVFPRMDLSGDYAIDEGGALNLPRLGVFMAADRTETEVQAELATAFQQSLGRAIDVRIEIAERLPVYVLGKVRASGTFRHMPGMIVLQAVAHAGGMDPSMGDASRMIEAIREAERMRQAEDRLSRLAVTHARLVALRDNHDLQVPEGVRSRLAEAMRPQGLQALIEGEAATLAVERLRRQQQLVLANRQIGIAQTEIEAVRKRGEQFSTLLAWKTAKLQELEQVASRGHLSHFRITEANVDIADVSARLEDSRVAMAQAERRLAEAEIVRARVELEHSIEAAKEISQITQEMNDCAQSIESMRSVEQVLRNGTAVADGPAAHSQSGITITRKSRDGFVTFPAQETTRLVPGDVIRVNLEQEAGRPAALQDGSQGFVRQGRQEESISTN